MGESFCLGFFMHGVILWWKIPHLVNHGHPPINVVGLNHALNHGVSCFVFHVLNSESICMESFGMLESQGTSTLRIQPCQDQKLAIELPWRKSDFCWFPTDQSRTAKGGSSDPKSKLLGAGGSNQCAARFVVQSSDSS